jgi:hypothetical protein
VVVEDVDDPDALAAGEPDLGAVDLPEAIRHRALEAQCRLRPARRLRRDQPVALKRPMDRRLRRWIDAGGGELSPDPKGMAFRRQPFADPRICSETVFVHSARLSLRTLRVAELGGPSLSPSRSLEVPRGRPKTIAPGTGEPARRC